MGYKSYSYGNEDIDNVQRDPANFGPSDLLVDAASNANTLILSAKFDNVYRYVIEGQFEYSISKSTYADVKKSVATSTSQYENGVLTQREIFEDGVDLNVVIFGSYRETLGFYVGDDYFAGSPTKSNDDNVRGYTGNDTFVGYGSGQYGDYFNGESGFDKAILRGKASEYTIASTSIWDILKNDGSRTPGFEVKDKTANRDGTDYYNNVERLYFSDKVVALDIAGNAGQAYRLYQAALDRTPDANGLAGWIKFMDEGGALSSMAQSFIDSQEFRTKYGALDDRNFVNQLYLNVLDRNGEAAGITGWVNGMANGLTRADVLKGFSESGENQANVLGQIKNGISYTEWWLS